TIRSGDDTVSGTSKLKNINNSDGLKYVAKAGDVVANGLHTCVDGEIILYPGVYSSIGISGGQVYFVPGIYVIKTTGSHSLDFNSAVVNAQGVMFYSTGSDYDPVSGGPDSNDKNNTPVSNNTTNFGDISISAGMSFQPLDTTTYNYAAMYSGA